MHCSSSLLTVLTLELLFSDVSSAVEVRPRLRHPPPGLRDGRQRVRVARLESFKGGCGRDEGLHRRGETGRTGTLHCSFLFDTA